jgi:hypothetical protein
LPAELVGDAEIEANRLGVTDMQVAVRLRRKARDHGFVPPGRQIGAHDVANEILACFASGLLYGRLDNRHGSIRMVPPKQPATHRFLKPKMRLRPGLDKKAGGVKPGAEKACPGLLSLTLKRAKRARARGSGLQ